LIPPSSFVPKSSLHSIPLHSSTRNQAVLSPPTSLAVWDQNQISISVLQCTFPPCDFWLVFLQIYSLFVSLLQKLFRHRRERRFFRALGAHITCKLRSAHSVSVLRQKKDFPPLGGLTLIAQSQQRKKSPHKKTVYQSRQSRRVLLCQATSVWVLPRITNFTNHSHHYTASTTRCKE